MREKTVVSATNYLLFINVQLKIQRFSKLTIRLMEISYFMDINAICIILSKYAQDKSEAFI